MGRLRARLAHKPPGYRFTIGRILAIYAGLMVALFLAALDQTIVATALPRVVSDLGGISQYSWVFTAYLLASTVTVPLYGKLGDVHGRRPLLLVSVTIFLVGSALCGLAQNMTQLVIFRGIQGIGAGVLFPLSLAVIGAIVPARDRGRYQGLFGATFAAASIVGPLVGGFIVDNTTWRWIFYVNLPVGGLALAVILVTMPRRPYKQEHSIDWLWAPVLGAGTPTLLPGLLAAFALVERSVREPIIPFDLLRNGTVGASVACMALVGMAMFGTISFVPLFVQGVIGTSATSSGVVLTPLMLGAVTASVLSGQWVSRSGRTRPNAIAGPIVLTAGMFLLWQMSVHTSNGEAARNMVLAGVGLGLMMQVFVLAVQNAVPRESIGSATALTQFARSIGGTLGVTIMGVIVNQGLPAGAGRGAFVVHRLHGPARATLAHALQPAFFAAMWISALVLPVVLVGVKDVRLRRGFDDVTEEVAGPAAAPP